MEIVDVDMDDEVSVATEETGTAGSEKSKGKRRLTLPSVSIGSTPKRKRVEIADPRTDAGQTEGDRDSTGRESFTPSEQALREGGTENPLPMELSDLLFTAGDDVDIGHVPKLYKQVRDP